jgi:hypothetical protein
MLDGPILALTAFARSSKRAVSPARQRLNSVSRIARVSDLEAHLNARLLSRTTRRLS